jgi:hypothetical protein
MARRRIIHVIGQHAPLPLCGKCLAKLAETSTTTVISVTTALAATPAYFRSTATCSWCGSLRLCIHQGSAGGFAGRPEAPPAEPTLPAA